MKRTFHNTKVSVKLRKSNRADEWYLVVESYPVYEKFSDKPKRIRENINRVITTPLWDKSKTTRGGADGKETYMPKRDVNGVIQCKAAVDQRACLYADVRRDNVNMTTLPYIRKRKLPRQNRTNVRNATLSNM